MLKFFRLKLRYKIRKLYICRVKSIPIMEDVDIGENNFYAENRILYFNTETFYDPITSEHFYLNGRNYTSKGLLISEIIGRIDYAYELPDDILLKGDYLTLASIIEFDSIIKSLKD